MLSVELCWRDVDPSAHAFDPDLARPVAVAQVLAAVDDDPRGQPLAGRGRDAVEAAIDRDLVGTYGAWAAGWRWAASEPGGGGPVRSWCCARHSLFRQGDADAFASVDRVEAALLEWRAFLVELGGHFDALRAATAGMSLAQSAEHAASRLLPLVLERTSAEDAWYNTFAQVVTWYLESTGLEASPIRPAVFALMSGRFASWCQPAPDQAATACGELGRRVAEVAGPRGRPDAVDGLGAWLARRGGEVERASSAIQRPATDADAHRAFIDGPERARDAVRADRMRRALAACRAAAGRGEPLSFNLLASWQAIVLDDPAVAFRAADAYAKGGRERYPLAGDTRATFDAALADAGDATRRAALRAARVYLDVLFFHPFSDGNARAARLALDHVLTRAGLTLIGAEPLFVIARSATDPLALAALADLIDQLAAPLAAAT